MTLAIILSGKDSNKGNYLVFGSDSRGETYFPSTSDKMIKHYKLNENSGLAVAGNANIFKEILDLIDNPSITGYENVYELSSQIGEKYRYVWEKHTTPRRMTSNLYGSPMKPFGVNLAIGGLERNPKLYYISEAGECTPLIDGYVALGSGSIYAKPRIEDWIRCAEAEFNVPTEIPKLSLDSAVSCVYYVIEDAKRRTSEVGGSTHISVITSKGWRDLNENLSELEPNIKKIMRDLDRELTKK
jgi:20S proteasome alpha/beta subunit